MKKLLIILLTAFLIFQNNVQAQVCASPTRDGDNLSLSGTVNTFWTPALGVYDASDSVIGISSRRGEPTNIVAGDLVLIVQMQCANIDFSDTASYGDGVLGDTSFGTPIATGYSDPLSTCLAGQYEYVRAGSSSSATNLDLTENPLVNTYVQANATATIGRRSFQVIRVPQYENATLSGNITTSVWNGFSGGVVALDIADTLDFNSNNINTNGSGFRGGGGRERSSNDSVVRYRWDVDDRHASKGEGIAGTPRFVSEKRDNSSSGAAITDLGVSWGGYPDGTASDGNFARGAPANAGGGGNFWGGGSDNGGGGAGGNGGAGGRGGAGWRSAGYAGVNSDYSNLSDQKWGFGGSAFIPSISRVVLGGGGGAGDNNANSTDNLSSGAAGGGIVMIRAREVLGTGQILARGARAASNTSNDAAGAGGAGGSVILVATDMSTSSITINVSGGRGGDAWTAGTTAHGGGGGGGGGVIYRNGTVTANISGGTNGITNTGDSPSDGVNHGAKPGDSGVNQLITIPTDTPGINTGFRCLDFGDADNSYGLASHNLNQTPTNLHLGALIPDGDSSTLSSIPSSNADFDDNTSNDDEDGVVLVSASSLSGIYTASVTALNNSGGNANLCGWIDFDQDGSFQSDEAVCTIVSSMISSQSIDLDFTVPLADRDNIGQFVARFRLSTDTLNTSTATGFANDGEVEDYVVTINTLPVSVHKFESNIVGKVLYANWSTSSETQNAGFNIWGVSDGKLSQLNQKLIPTKNQGVLKSTDYKAILELKSKKIEELALTAIDIKGKEEVFGYYKLNQTYGRSYKTNPINWNSINQKINSSSVKTADKLLKTITTDLKKYRVFVNPNEKGMQEISYEDLLNFGIDFEGIAINDIAVTVKGTPVSRFIGKAPVYTDLIFGNTFESNLEDLFGPEYKIQFWAEKAGFPDALYLDFYTYEISVNPSGVKRSQTTAITSTDIHDTYLHKITVNEDNNYAFTSASDDPWYAKRLNNFSSEEAKSYKHIFDIDSQLVSNKKGVIEVSMAGGTDMPENPDHEVSVFINEQLIHTKQFNGIEAVELKLEVPENLLVQGNNTVEVKLTEGTQAIYDVVTIDKIILGYPRYLKLIDNTLLIDSMNIASSLVLDEINLDLGSDYLAYLYDGNHLSLLETKLIDSNLLVATNSLVSSSYWISTSDRIHKPEIVEIAETVNLNEYQANYLIIAHPAFMPATSQEVHPLNTYMNAKSSEGWNVKLLGIDTLQKQYTSGMNLPEAVKLHLKDHESYSKVDHVLLVGSDSYDYKDNLGINSVSFIPTIYTPTVFIPHTPSDALLTDINDDGVSDIAIGRWPVRTLEELDSTVTKTLDWSNANDLSAVFITDIEENDIYSFESQANRMIDSVNSIDSEAIEVVEIYSNSISINEGESVADTARQMLFSEWERKHSISNFIGHSSPTQWSRQGILASGDLQFLNNSNTSTLIGTLSCYSSYFVSPETNSLSLSLMNGSNDQKNGAVAIHGAATLSGYSGNEVFADKVLKLQLQGETLGGAILKARIAGKALGFNDQVVNWTLLGDPTLKVKLED